MQGTKWRLRVKFGDPVVEIVRMGSRMIIHFEFEGGRSWEVMGSGIGDGEDPVGTALADLRSLHGGELPAGTYRYIEARAGDARWEPLELGERGEILH
jgi:hypothetical protein